MCLPIGPWMADVGPGGSPCHLCLRLPRWVLLDAAFDVIGGRAAPGLAGRPAADLGGLLLLAAVVAMVAASSRELTAPGLPDRSRRHDCPGRPPCARAGRTPC